MSRTPSAEAAPPDLGAEGDGPVDFDGLYRKHWAPMIRVAQALVDDVASAEDITQEAFATLYRNRRRLRDPAAAADYLRTSVVNGARSALRRRRIARLHVVGADHETAPAADHRIVQTAQQQAVRQALAQLPRRQREVLTLRFLADLTDKEIADVIGTSHANVRSAASRGLTTLRANLEGKS